MTAGAIGRLAEMANADARLARRTCSGSSATCARCWPRSSKALAGPPTKGKRPTPSLTAAGRRKRQAGNRAELRMSESDGRHTQKFC